MPSAADYMRLGEMPQKIANSIAQGRETEQVLQSNRLANLRSQQSLQAGKMEMNALKADQQRQNRLAGLRQNAVAGQENAMSELAAFDPKEAKELQEALSGMTEQQREAAKRNSEDIARAAAWADTPEKWEVVKKTFAAEGKQLPPQVQSFENRGLAIARARSLDSMLNSGTYSKSLTPAVGPDGQPVFLQGTASGGARPLEGYRPAGPEYKGREAAAIQRAKESTPGGQAKVQADRAQASQAQEKARKAEAERDKGEQMRLRIVDLTGRLLDPSRRDALESATGSIQGSAFAPTLRQSSADIEADFDALAAMLTSGEMSTMSGVLSDSDLKILRDVASGGLTMTSSTPRLVRILSKIRDSAQRRVGNGGRASGQGGSQSVSPQQMSDDDLKQELGL